MTATDLVTARARAIADTVMAYPFKVWAFAESIGVRSVWQAGLVLHEPRYQHWAISMLEEWLHRAPILEEPDHCAPGIVLLDAYEATQDQRYLDLALRLAEYMDNLPRDGSGATFHRPHHPDFHHYLYVDCMEVDAPFLCRLAQVTGAPGYADRGAAQIASYSQLLQDPSTGLFWHQYNGETGRVNGAFWGRGNGWAMLGLLETLRLLPRRHPAWNPLHERLSKLAERLVACQLPSGDWPTVLDRLETYAEGSLPAFFYYGLAEGMHEGLLPDRYACAAMRAWEALNRRMASDGVLLGVSIATPPGDAEHYARIPTGVVAPWGQAPALLAHLARRA